MNNFTLKVNPGKYLLTLTSFGSFDEKSPWRSKQDFDPDSIRLQLFPCNSAFTAVDCVADTANKKILNETKKELALRFQQCLLGNILVNGTCFKRGDICSAGNSLASVRPFGSLINLARKLFAYLHARLFGLGVRFWVRREESNFFFIFNFTFILI